MELIVTLDEKLFYLFNIMLANKICDFVMPLITNLDHWKIPIVVIWLVLIIKGGKKGRVVGILFIPVLVLTDQMSASVFKPFFERLRPCHSLDEVRLLVNCGGKYGFPSSHATNISGFAMLFSIIYSRYWYWFWLIAVLIGFSRIYVGVHYPGDVLFGYVIGILIAIVVYICYSFLTKKYPIIDYRVSLK